MTSCGSDHPKPIVPLSRGNDGLQEVRLEWFSRLGAL